MYNNLLGKEIPGQFGFIEDIGRTLQMMSQGSAGVRTRGTNGTCALMDGDGERRHS